LQLLSKVFFPLFFIPKKIEKNLYLFVTLYCITLFSSEWKVGYMRSQHIGLSFDPTFITFGECSGSGDKHKEIHNSFSLPSPSFSLPPPWFFVAFSFLQFSLVVVVVVVEVVVVDVV
jgi:hypothetical protein